MNRKKLIKISVIALALILISDFLIFLNFELNPRFYLIHHFLGGFFVALFFYGYLSDIITAPNIKTIKKWIVIIGATLFVGVVWEFAEYIGTYTQIKNLNLLKIGDLHDTIADLFVDLLGAITLLGFLHKRFRRKKS